MSFSQGFGDVPESGTWFAPASRASDEALRELTGFCLHNPITQAIIASVEGYVLILNEQRQVLAANPDVLKALDVHEMEYLLGLRPGEAFGCVYSTETPGGCGTSKACSTCGAVISIIASSVLAQPSVNECLMSVDRDGKIEAHEFSVRATPLTLGGNRLTIFVIHDISASKRRDVLENLFIHDLNNIITGLQGWSEILVRRPHDATAIAQRIVGLSSHLTQEVQNQRLLLQAERGELKAPFEQIRVTEVLDGMKSFFAGYPPDKAHRIDIVAVENDLTMRTCPPLLTRVLANMLKNALEATSPQERVSIWFELRDGAPCFVVHNPGEIPESVALQIFKRSFSTKSSHGRGLGTYSMKLFGEQYLGGSVDFSTSNDEGTSFFICLPHS